MTRQGSTTWTSTRPNGCALACARSRGPETRTRVLGGGLGESEGLPAPPERLAWGVRPSGGHSGRAFACVRRHRAQSSAAMCAWEGGSARSRRSTRMLAFLTTQQRNGGAGAGTECHRLSAVASARYRRYSPVPQRAPSFDWPLRKRSAHTPHFSTMQQRSSSPPFTEEMRRASPDRPATTTGGELLLTGPPPIPPRPAEWDRGDAGADLQVRERDQRSLSGSLFLSPLSIAFCLSPPLPLPLPLSLSLCLCFCLSLSHY
jgi:hypothetical protein